MNKIFRNIGMHQLSLALLTYLFFSFGDRTKEASEIRLESEYYIFIIEKENAAFRLEDKQQKQLLAPHSISGILMADKKRKSLSSASIESYEIHNSHLAGVLSNKYGEKAIFEVHLEKDYLQIKIKPKSPGGRLTMEVRTATMSPVYGLGDHGGYEGKANLFGFRSDHFINDKTAAFNWNHYRFISTFAIFPAHNLAQVIFDRGGKRVAIDEKENKMGVNNSRELNAFYFLGEPKQIYSTYKRVKEKEGYPDKKPKFDFFELGYEAFGSLGWNTYQHSVQADIETYLRKGYPIKWAVVGSGFWKGERRNPQEGSTTAFGIWDDEKTAGRNDGLPNPRYPDVQALKSFLKQNGIKLLLGSRINFKALEQDGGHYIPENDGKYVMEGLKMGHFVLKENGEPELFKVNFPQGNTYLLNTDSSEAVKWFVDQYDKWGVDGVKEDLMLQDGVLLGNDGKLNPVNEILMDQGKMVMVRNSAYGVPGDVLRLEDTKYGFDQDRTLINSLNYAFSGVVNIYPDIVAGKYLKNPLSEDEKRYFVRNAMMAAVMPVMSMGYGPWHMENQEYEKVVKKAVNIHHQLVPYMYSEVLRGFYTGYPYALNPLPLAFPQDQNTYHLADSTKRQYSWLIGESLLAAPAYGNDYATVQSRDIYFPEGKWMDWETKEVMEGPSFVKNYPIPDEKIPLWIGGKDIVVLREGDNLIAFYFPLNFGGEPYAFHFPDGHSRSSFETPSQSGDKYFLIQEGVPNKALSFDPALQAYRFSIEPNQQYKIVAE